MNRNVPLRSTTELKRTSPLERGSSLRMTGIAPGERMTGSRPKSAARDTGPSRKVRALVLERDGHACVCCGRSVIGQVYSLQHRKRRSQGGGNSPSNLVTVLGDGTRGCHQRIDSRRDPADGAKGFTVRSWQDPALIPVMVFSEHGSGAAVYLTSEGTYSCEAPEGIEVA